MIKVLSFFSRTCEHIKPGMKSLVVSDDEAGEKDDNNNDSAHHEANHPIVTLNKGHIAEIELFSLKSLKHYFFRLTWKTA